MISDSLKEKKSDIIRLIKDLECELKNIRSVISDIRKNLTKEESKLIELKIKKESLEQELINLENFL